MTTSSNKALYRRYIEEAFNKGNLALLDELLAPNYVYHDAPPDIAPGKEGLKQVIMMFRKGFPDFTITIDEQIAEGDLVCSRATSRGTHKGEIFGFAPTGKQVEFKGITIVRVVDGKIAESWVKNDGIALMKQVGMRPPAK